jgi:hypothetical protein
LILRTPARGTRHTVAVAVAVAVNDHDHVYVYVYGIAGISNRSVF